MVEKRKTADKKGRREDQKRGSFLTLDLTPRSTLKVIATSLGLNPDVKREELERSVAEAEVEILRPRAAYQYHMWAQSRGYTLSNAPGLEVGDLLSAAWIGVRKLRVRYDPKLSSYATFVRVRGDYALRDELRKYQQPVGLVPQRTREPSPTLKLVAQEERPRANPSRGPEGHLEIERLLGTLDERERGVVIQRLRGVRNRDIGKAYGCSESRVSQLYSCAIKKLRRYTTHGTSINHKAKNIRLRAAGG